MKKEFICIVCPNSCRITAEYNEQEIKHIEGAQCKKGEEFIKNEIQNPLRIFAGSVKCKNGDYQLVSVKTNKPIPKKYMKKVAQKTHELVVEAPVEIGQVIFSDILGKDADLVATRKVRKKVL
ncbi:MAG: DUF1667 domain-containing protein [Desulfatiglandales bacterium]